MLATSSKRIPLLVAVILIALLAGVVVWRLAGHGQETTNDAYVTADYTLVAPRISGHIAEVRVEDNQQVEAGQLLARIDDRDYINALNTAQATLESKQAQLKSLDAQLIKQQQVIVQARAALDSSVAGMNYARQSADRYRRLLQQGSGTADQRDESDATYREKAAAHQSDVAALEAAQQEVDVLKAERAEALAAIDAANADLSQAKLNLSYTRITAPVAGTVGQRSLRVGAYVSAGTRVLAVVPLQHAYIVANYLETQLGGVVPDQPVSIRVDALPDAVLHGHVESIAPATGATFSPIAADNATGNFTKVAQRLAVKIVLDADQPLVQRLRVGMSVVPTIDTAHP
ncbi:MAG: HlyD family secretion protein [Yersiniaceae bacterium]|nr:HlyD family secretion protein [Yersiniaceae bacterium]